MDASFQLSLDQLFGVLSLLTAISYGSYMLTVKLRETCPPQRSWRGAVCSLFH